MRLPVSCDLTRVQQARPEISLLRHSAYSFGPRSAPCGQSAAQKANFLGKIAFSRISVGQRDGSVCRFLVVRGRLGDENNSRFGGLNSRLGRHKFPVSPATGIHLQRIDFPRHFRCRIGAFREQSKKFPVQREKPGMLLHTGIAAASWKAAGWGSRKWQATLWPGRTSRISGSSVEQRSKA